MSRASKPTPFRDGFAAVWHEPALLAAELAWRWCFGLSALTLGVLSLGLFLDSVKVSKIDEFLISTLQPQLLAGAFRHIFHGSLPRFLLEQALLVLGLTLLWAFASAAGRAATLRRLVAMFSTDDEERPQSMEWHFGSIFLLHLLRAAWAQIALVVTAILFVYGSAMAVGERPIAAAFALSFGVGFACFVGFSLNWYLGIAPLFCIRNDVSAREALDQALEFSGRHSGRLFVMGLGFFALRLIWAGTMGLAFISPLSFAGTIGNRWVLFLMALVALVYCAGADLLHLARWGAYVSLAEDDAHPTPEPESETPLPPAAPIEIVPLEGLA